MACDSRTTNTYDKLLECVRLDGVREHQVALQAIAGAHGGTRAAATPGYAASVAYVVNTLNAAGWSVSLDEFDFTVAEPIQRTAPTPATFDSSGVTGSVLGTVTGAGVPVDINLTPPRDKPQQNVIAELRGSNNGNVVMAGAHLDSVEAGPGHQRQRQRFCRVAGARSRS